MKQTLVTQYDSYYRAQHAEIANKVARMHDRKLTLLKEKIQNKAIGGDLAEAKIVYAGMKGTTVGMVIGLSVGLALSLIQFLAEHGGISLLQSPTALSEFVVGFSFLPPATGVILGAVVGTMQGTLHGVEHNVKQYAGKYN